MQYPSLPVAAESCLTADRSRVDLGAPLDSSAHLMYVADRFDDSDGSITSLQRSREQHASAEHSSSSRPLLLPPTAGVRLLTTRPSGEDSEPLCHVLPGSVSAEPALVHATDPERNLAERVPCSGLDLRAAGKAGRSILVIDDEGTDQRATAVFEVAPIASLAICGPATGTTFSPTRFSIALQDSVGRVFSAGRGIDCLPTAAVSQGRGSDAEFIERTILAGHAAGQRTEDSEPYTAC